MKRLVALVILILVCMLASTVSAGVPLGGLAVALSPDGKVMAAAGDNRTLYVLDPAKMEVVQRVWLGVCIINLEFNKDGSTLVVEDSDGTLHLLDTGNWQEKKNLPKAGSMTTAPLVDLAAGLDPDYNGHVIRILSMSDLSEKGQLKFEKGRKVVAIGLDAQGQRLAVMFESVNDESEPKGAKPPAELKGLEAEDFKLKNDGKTTVLAVYKVPGGELISENKIYYSPSYTGAKLLFQGENPVVVNYSNLNAIVDAKGNVTLFALQNSYNYGLGFSADQKVIMSGGLSVGTYTKTADMSGTVFKPDKLPGWPEYFKGFTVASDGTAYGSTSGYRIMKISPSGAFEKSVPVY